MNASKSKQRLNEFSLANLSVVDSRFHRFSTSTASRNLLSSKQYWRNRWLLHSSRCLLTKRSHSISCAMVLTPAWTLEENRTLNFKLAPAFCQNGSVTSYSKPKEFLRFVLSKTLFTFLRICKWSLKLSSSTKIDISKSDASLSNVPFKSDPKTTIWAYENSSAVFMSRSICWATA